ncbi:MAG: Gfo/Idh/MocA family oxidoreductase [Isosphaeraceae bacterium]|nr:Gfo/Idh/MocA family oxidoreductase [Isosphaeraceae bacterium]
MRRGELRIGIVGAGAITRARHLPGFRALPGVKVVGVCNLRRESSVRVAREFDIPRIFDSWEHLVEADDIDAVVIGAWPYLHCPITLAALGAGKHVLTQARMAMNAREAQRMLDKAREHPDLTAMIVPSPYGLTGDAFMRQLIADGYLGQLREVHVTGLSSDLADRSTPLGWRQVARYSGFNTLNLGILHETVLRWTPPVRRVFAYVAKHVPQRRDPETGQKVPVGTADSVQVLSVQEGNSTGVYRVSGVVWHNTGNEIALYGSAGTLVYDLTRDEIRGAPAYERELKPLPIPEGLRGGWQVEADFVAAIRGERPVTHTDFVTGVRYMQFTEAVIRSSRHQRPVDLPLKEFSSPTL